MSLADDLLEQAEMLARREPKNPKQVSLRRAVSAAYYALFHLLTEDAARLFGTLVGRDDTATVGRLVRTFDHKVLKYACKAFASSQLPSVLRADGETYRTPSDLKVVADVFVALQEARHTADYDTSRVHTRADVESHVREVRKAFDAWGRVKNTHANDARSFLASFSLLSTWNKQR